MLREPPEFRSLPQASKARIRAFGAPSGRREAIGADAYREWLKTPGGTLGALGAGLGMLLAGLLLGEVALALTMGGAALIIAGFHQFWLRRRLDRDLVELRRDHPDWFADSEFVDR